MYVVYRQASSPHDEFPEVTDAEMGMLEKHLHSPLLDRKTRTFSESLDETMTTSASRKTTEVDYFIKSSSNDK